MVHQSECVSVCVSRWKPHLSKTHLSLKRKQLKDDEKSVRKKILCSDWTKTEHLGLISKHHVSTHTECWWWQHHAGVCFSAAGPETHQDKGRADWRKYRDLLYGNLIQSAQDLGLGSRSGLRTRLWMSLRGSARSLTWSWRGSVECHNIPKSNCANPATSYPRRLEAAAAAKGSSTKHRGKGHIVIIM